MKKEIPVQAKKAIIPLGAVSRRQIKPIAPRSDADAVGTEDSFSVEKEISVTSVQTKRKCSFCAAKATPSYTDIATLKRYLTDRARIVSKEKSGICSKHQRRITKEIKHARHLALLSFTPRV
ncbi:30S ribosomal protein S18 [Candidatus Daviesbacteria bacterium]|nr:30S ribosomal protein S18 [Candidatus Daviesbacteria bacterium]